MHEPTLTPWDASRALDVLTFGLGNETLALIHQHRRT